MRRSWFHLDIVRSCAPRGYVPCRADVNAVWPLVILLITLFAMWSPRVSATEPLRLLVLGDSLTAGYGLLAEHGFTNRLERALAAKGRSVTVLNAGVSGDTTAGGLSRLGWALADKPHAMIVELGANDGLRGLDPESTEQNLDAILKQAKMSNVPVLLAGMLAPPNLGQEYALEFNGIFPRLAEEYDVLFYPFFLDGVALRPDLNQDDGIHPNAAGVDEVVRRILTYVENLLDRASLVAGGGKSRT